jgi:hypothetical protein
LIAERHDLITQIKHYSSAELFAELSPQRLERREVGRTPLSNMTGVLVMARRTESSIWRRIIVG